MEFGKLNQAQRKAFVVPGSTLANQTSASVGSVDLTKVGATQLGILVSRPETPYIKNYQVMGTPAYSAAAKYQLIQGVNRPESVRRLLHGNADNNVKRSVEFKAKDILRFTGKRGRKTAQSQTVALGWDGKNADTNFELAAYGDLVVNMKVWGNPIKEVLGNDGTWFTRFVISRECFDESMDIEDPALVKANKEKAADQFLQRYRERKIGTQWLHEYVSATKITDGAAYSGLVTNDTFELIVPDGGDAASLGAVQTKYPALEVERLLYDGGYSTYRVVTADGAATPADYTNEALTTLPYCDVCPTGYTEVDGICTLTVPGTFDWVAGPSLTRAPKTLRLTLKDSECGTTRLPAVQAAYAELTTTADSVANCVRNYTTTILSDPIEPGCHPDYYRWSTFPDDFHDSAWVDVTADRDEPDHLGIIFEGNIFIKPFDPTLVDYHTQHVGQADGVHIQISTHSNNWHGSNCGEDIPVTVLSNYEYPAGEGWYMREMEMETESRELNSYIHMPAVRAAFGTYLLSDPTQFYDSYDLEVHGPKNGAFDEVAEDTYLYKIYFPVGKGKAFEDAINALITGLGASAEIETFTLFDE